MKVFTMLEFSKLISVNPRTLARWDRNGVFRAHKKPTGRRFYTEQHYIEYCNQSGLPIDLTVLSDEQRNNLKRKTGDKES